MYEIVVNYMILYDIVTRICGIVMIGKYNRKHLTEALGAFCVACKVPADDPLVGGLIRKIPTPRGGSNAAYGTRTKHRKDGDCIC